MGWVVVFLAFCLGIATDAVGSADHTVNILAPPLLLLMVWNLVVYGLIVLNTLFKSRHFKLPKLDQTEALALARGTTVMHWGAAALALGALLAMYWRGLVFDYQALWQSTFLSAATAHQLVHAILTPAAWLGSLLGGSALPDLANFELLRAPIAQGQGVQGENAARWIHWYAITVFLVVLLPRSLLALWSYRTTRQLQGVQGVKGSQASLTPKSPLAPPPSYDETAYSAVQTIALSLIAHTNVGKTTLARTLLGRDIGEVRDAEHVTHTAERHVLVQAPYADVLERLELWDTPGFGDSELLAKRLSQAGNPIAWFLSEVWDRLQNRAFWYSQRAVRHILDQSDVVLYLVNASEAPADVAYLDAELKVLDLICKPVIVLLNQVGPPATPEQTSTQLQHWRERIGPKHMVKEVLLLDAFTRCWVQEGRLLQTVAQVLPKRHAMMERLSAAWQDRNVQRWQSSMQVLAQRLSRAALDREVIAGVGWTGKLVEAGAALGNVIVGAMGLRREGAQTPKEQAMTRLAQRLDVDIRSSTDALIALHGLDGQASKLVLTRLAEHYALQVPKSEGKAALWGGVVTGALAGLKADILSGGLTLGGGMLAGGVLGALGAAGLARGYNLVTGVDVPTLAWTPEVLDELVKSALLGYLTVAHFGRGRGAWTATEPPAFWLERIEVALASEIHHLHELWNDGKNADTTGDLRLLVDVDLSRQLQALLMQISQTLLQSLYPDVKQVWIHKIASKRA